MRRVLEAFGAVLRIALRGLFTAARALDAFDRTFVARAGDTFLAAGGALASVISRAHRGTPQDMLLLDLAGLALLLVGRLFGS